MTPYYSEDGITIYHGDCREVLPQVERVALVLTDPPYGVNVAKWDVVDWDWAKHVARVLPDNGHLFCFWSVAKLREFPDIPGMTYERVLVWSKPMTFSAQRAGATWHWEPIFWWKKGTPKLSECVSDVLTVNPVLTRLHAENVAHPTQKPLSLLLRLVELGTEEEDVPVLDPFMGSGTTLVAAKQLGRQAIGIEIEEKYCEIAAKRLQQGVLALEVP